MMKQKHIILISLLVITLFGIGGWYLLSKNQPKAEKQPIKAAEVPKLDCSGGLIKEDVLSGINRERMNNGSPIVTEDLELSQIAQDRANKLDGKMDVYTDNGQIHHKGFQELVRDKLLPSRYIYFAENLAESCNSKTAVKSWMTSKEGHRETLLNPRYGKIGIGIYKGVAVTIYGDLK